MFFQFDVTPESLGLLISEFESVYQNSEWIEKHFILERLLDNQSSADEEIQRIIVQIPPLFICPFKTRADYRTKLESFKTVFSNEMEDRIRQAAKKYRNLFSYKQIVREKFTQVSALLEQFNNT
jgi:hypothetical protein